MASADLSRAIDLLKKLFNDRHAPEWWSQNIIDASRHLSKPEDWTKFYSYMANPQNFDPDQTVVPMTDDEIKKAEAMLELPAGLEEVIFQKGPEDTTVHVRKIPVVVDDEKVSA